MKNIYLLVISITLFLGCNENEKVDSGFSESDKATLINIEKGILEGNLYETKTLTGNYVLKDMFVVKKGASLVISKGTQIVAATDGILPMIVVEKGAKIHVNGTAEKPVLITSPLVDAFDDKLLWGGLMICGKASVYDESGNTIKNFLTDVGGFSYGGNSSYDSSGNISYLVIRKPGSGINLSRVTCGLSLNGVGSNTKINNIAIWNSGHNAVQISGGNVNISNLYIKGVAENQKKQNLASAINWTKGWSGTVKNMYCEIKNYRAIALSGTGSNRTPNFNNLTITSTAQYNPTYKVTPQAILFKDKTGANFTNLHMTLDPTSKNIVIGEGNSYDNILVNNLKADGTTVYTGTEVDLSDWNWKEVNN